jgi:hypothetical protein
VTRSVASRACIPLACVALIVGGCGGPEDADKSECRTNLRLIRIAAESCQEAHGVPCWKTPTVGKTGFSWRVELLPYLEHDNLYRTLATQTANFTARVYTAEGLPTANAERVRDVTSRAIRDYTLLKRNHPGDTTIFRRVVRADRPDAFVVVETTDVVPWARGDDELVVEVGKALPERPGMGGHFSGGFVALCADGKVRWVPSSLSDDEKLAALFDGRGGEEQ